MARLASSLLHSEFAISRDFMWIREATRDFPNTLVTTRIHGFRNHTVKVKLHYAYKVRNIGRVRPILRYCVV